MGNTIDMNELEPVARPLLPIFFHQARFLLKITVRFKAICLKNLRPTGRKIPKIQISRV